jgi:hypothetical protein
VEVVYESQQLNLHTELHFIPSWSYSIDHQIDYNMRENIYLIYFFKLNLSKNSLNTDSFKDTASKSFNWYEFFNIVLF